MYESLYDDTLGMREHKRRLVKYAPRLYAGIRLLALCIGQFYKIRIRGLTQSPLEMSSFKKLQEKVNCHDTQGDPVWK